MGCLLKKTFKALPETAKKADGLDTRALLSPKSFYVDYYSTHFSGFYKRIVKKVIFLILLNYSFFVLKKGS